MRREKTGLVLIENEGFGISEERIPGLKKSLQYLD